MREGQGGGGAQVKIHNRPRLILIVSATITLAADQISKVAAVAALEPHQRVDLLGSFFGLLLIRNPGGAFSLLRTRSGLLAGLTAIVVVLVVVWALRSKEFPLELGMVIGGGLGNLADRVFRAPGLFEGRVVDFIDFSFWPTFNLADTAITIGVGLLVMRSLWPWRAGRT